MLAMNPRVTISFKSLSRILSWSFPLERYLLVLDSYCSVIPVLVSNDHSPRSETQISAQGRVYSYLFYSFCACKPIYQPFTILSPTFFTISLRPMFSILIHEPLRP